MDASDLSCTFNEPCCWSDNTAGSTELTGQVVTNPGQIGTCYPGSVPTSGPFYSVYGQNLQPHPGASAELESCPVQCSKQNTVDVTVSAFKSATSKLEVCSRPGDTGALENCQTYLGTSGQSQTFGLPGGENYQIVLVASDFNLATDYVNIEEIQVTAEPCDETTTSAPTTEATTPVTTEQSTTPVESTTAVDPFVSVCEKIKCDFTNDLCNWVSTPVGNAPQFKNYQAGYIVGNLDTGVNAMGVAQNHPMTLPEVSETAFAATPMGPQSTAVMSVGNLAMPGNVRLQFKAYDATFNHLLKACLNGQQTCQGVTESGAALDHRQWLDFSVPVPADTQSIELVAENNGNYYGAIGVHDIHLVVDAPGEPNDGELIC